jgi:hypothetical protein
LCQRHQQSHDPGLSGGSILWRLGNRREEKSSRAWTEQSQAQTEAALLRALFRGLLCMTSLANCVCDQHIPSPPGHSVHAPIFFQASRDPEGMPLGATVPGVSSQLLTGGGSSGTKGGRMNSACVLLLSQATASTKSTKLQRICRATCEGKTVTVLPTLADLLSSSMDAKQPQATTLTASYREAAI